MTFSHLLIILRARWRTAPGHRHNTHHVRAAIWGNVLLWWASIAALLGLLPSLVLAASIDPNEMRETFDVSPLLVGLALILCVVSAGTALLIRVDRELSAAPTRSLPHMLVFCASHMGGGLVAGVCAFLGAQSGAFDVWAGLLAVVVASFAGAKVVEALAERMFPSVGGAPKAPD